MRVRLGLGLLPALLAFACGAGPPVDRVPPPGNPAFRAGMSLFVFDRDVLGSPQADASLRRMRAAGIEWLSLVPYRFQASLTSSEIFETPWSSSPRSVRHALETAHALGLHVLLKPHVDPLDGNSRALIVPADPDEWFTQYARYLLEYAEMAQEEGVEELCVGTELAGVSPDTDRWRRLVREVRSIYRGRLTYASLFTEMDSVRFWDVLDDLGIDAYFPLSTRSSPSLEDLRTGWLPWVRSLEAFQARWGKPLLFTEIGYMSHNLGAVNPGDWQLPAHARVVPDPALQARAYEAALETFWDTPWMGGMFWWNWEVEPWAGGPDDVGYTPQGKPALGVLTHWWRHLAAPPPP